MKRQVIDTRAAWIRFLSARLFAACAAYCYFVFG